MKRKNLLSLTLIFVSCCTVLMAQPVITPLQYNAAQAQYQARKAAMPSPKMKVQDTVIHLLPFFDDFSKSKVVPDSAMWVDQFAYINNGFGIIPPSTGVATLDGLNQYGLPYKVGASQNYSQACDTLSSTYIDLSTFSPKDSIYLSFYYQAGGYGEHPERIESKDSLVLEFKSDSLYDGTEWHKNAWFPVWSQRGTVLDLPFQLVMIPLKKLTDTLYFQQKFQFRFISYGNPSGNLDVWNLDYIYMNRGRTRKDTAQDDVAVYYPVHSLSKRYYAMPWNQFADYITTEMVDSIPIFAKNNSRSVKNVTFGYDIINTRNGNVLGQEFNTQGDNLDAGGNRKFSLRSKVDNFPSEGSELTLQVRTVVSSIPDDHRMNDTAYRMQRFSNFLAYDDGTAESGVSLQGSRSIKAALRFILNQPDTLYGVAIYFNQSLDYVGNRSFNIAYWDKLTPINQNENDAPVASISYQKPHYENGQNGFYYFPFEEPIPVQNQFYLGWTQKDDYKLNIGVDEDYIFLNGNKPNENFFYSVQGQWKPFSQEIPPFKGAPMIRAILGRGGYSASVAAPSKAAMQARVYPNPSNGNFAVSLAAGESCQLRLTDLQGRLLDERSNIRSNQSLDYSDLQPGIYLLQIVSEKTGAMKVEKIIIR